VVQREMRGIGVGRFLMLFAEKQAIALELPEIRLYTGEVMTQNLYYYPGHGYSEIGRETVKGRARVWFAKSVKST
jgi:GNAT superfamily N-acetyltransferase